MKLFGHEVTGYAKALVILGAVFLVASGMCGIQLTHVFSNQRDPSLLIIFGVLEILAILISALGMIVVLLLWLRAALFGPMTRPEDSNPGEPHNTSVDSKHNDQP